ncbi:MAG: hypothetical protein M1814_001376 [Vezdaea aestivalis]|nr:MAG: hypothetical protein M1814_001376 [Vezdaea aestivalis]
MPAIAAVAEQVIREASKIVKRVKIPTSTSSPPGLIEANTRDPWSQSGKYSLGWVYMSIILLFFAMVMRLYHLWTDKIRTALHREVNRPTAESTPDYDYEMSNLDTSKSAAQLFPRQMEKGPPVVKDQSSVSSIRSFNVLMAVFRMVFYRPIPVLRFRKQQLVFPSLSVVVLVAISTIFTVLYCFIPQPLFWSSMQFGSPPLAVRAGMLAVAMMPWIIALSMKANFITFITGLGHERLNVLHRWGGYLCLLLSLIHTIPFYIQPAWDEGGFQVFKGYFVGNGAIYSTGIAALVPLIWLCVFSLPIIRYKAYEIFVALHVPVSIVFLGMLIWHCHNYLTSWAYLWATVAIWVLSYIGRLFKLNWTNPRAMSWLIGDECAVTLLGENAVKVTIPTQMKWRPGQYVYLRMPGISIFENHPFTISSLWSEDFPSEYGEEYRDMTLVFRPFGGFTRKVLNTAIEKGPWQTYRAFIDGPYGGMNRRLEAFDTVVLIAGGSGVTAMVSQLLQLVKRMRDGKAVTKKIHVIWAIKRLETMEWFKEELRICREYAPPDSINCQFFVTAAKRGVSMNLGPDGFPLPSPAQRPISGLFHDKLNNFAHGVASKRTSALIRDEAAGDPIREKELRTENTDVLAALPEAKLRGGPQPISNPLSAPTDPSSSSRPSTHRQRPSLSLNTTGISNFLPPPPPGPPPSTNNGLGLQIPAAAAVGRPMSEIQPAQQFDFGFPSTPTMFQKNLMRFAFGPRVKRHEGWTVEYGRPAVPFMLKAAAEGFGRRTCVFVCGPPDMRVDVQRTVAGLQKEVLRDPFKDEIFLHSENYAI